MENDGWSYGLLYIDESAFNESISCFFGFGKGQNHDLLLQKQSTDAKALSRCIRAPVLRSAGRPAPESGYF
jgi:hypothetical protein